MTAPAHTKAAEVLAWHQRIDPSGCTCGPMRLGTSHPAHQADMLAAEGLLPEDELASLRQRLLSLADWHETKAEKARRFPAPGAGAVMEKAAQVHDDAARRLRQLAAEYVDTDGVPSCETHGKPLDAEPCPDCSTPAPAPTLPPARRRLKACVEAWPDCESGAYNPACCRFPKSCSPYGYPETPDDALEDPR